jgi:molybdate-binding protein
VPEGDTWYLVDLAEREQGLMFRPARKPLVASAADVVRKRLRLADRQPESGTYRLTRRLIVEAGADPAGLQTVGPYSSHIEVGLAVRGGLADVGTGVRVAAEKCGLGFLPLHREKFRLAVPGRYLGHARVAEFLETLLAEFEAARKRNLPGYFFDSLGKMFPLRG